MVEELSQSTLLHNFFATCFLPTSFMKQIYFQEVYFIFIHLPCAILECINEYCKYSLSNEYLDCFNFYYPNSAVRDILITFLCTLMLVFL